MVAHPFDQIRQELLKQKQRMEKLETENRELREQIANLRSGRGIFVDIHGIRFALRDDSSLAHTTSAPSVPTSASPSTSTVAASTPSATPPFNQHIVDAPTEVIPEITAQQRQDQGIKEQVPSSNNGDKSTTTGESTFLEEIMLDEFNNALTSPKAVWQDPTAKKASKQRHKPQEAIDEKQKEALRRELTGSYLLE